MVVPKGLPRALAISAQIASAGIPGRAPRGSAPFFEQLPRKCRSAKTRPRPKKRAQVAKEGEVLGPGPKAREGE
jgi:hypothetical protein